MKFLVGNGEQLGDKLRNIPFSWINDFLHSKILVVAVENGDTVAAYGIRGMLNVTSLYVKETHRRRGIGGRIRNAAFNEARKRGMHFLLGEISFEHLSSKYGRSLCTKYGCRIIRPVEKHQASIIIFPLTKKGQFVYTVLRATFAVIPERLLGFLSEWVWRTTRAQ
jgi:GNAT superfamily N-acetyltransferase